MTEVINQWLNPIAEQILEGGILAALLTFLAGVLVAFMPCCLASVPLVVGYVAGVGDRSLKRSFSLSVVISLGAVVVSVAMGVIVSLIGMFQQYYFGSWWYILLGVILLYTTLQIWEIVPAYSNRWLGKSTKRGYVGAFIVGMLTALFSSPCATPILVVVLMLISQYGALGKGIFLMFLYSLGHSVLFILFGTFTSWVKKILNSKRYLVWNSMLKYTLGFFVMTIGLYFIYIGI